MHRGRQVSQQRGLDIVSSSPVRCIWLEQTPRPIPRELDRGEIYTIMDHYALIAAHAKCNGYDMVKIHGGHGYPVNSFMSPYLNKRTDEFGGNIENRMRFPLELIRRIKKDVGDEFPIGFRLSGDEFIEGGTTIDESPIMGRMLEEAGAAYIHVSAGLHEASHQVSDIMRYVL